MPNSLKLFIIAIILLSIASIIWAAAPLDWWHRIPLIAGVAGLIFIYKG